MQKLPLHPAQREVYLDQILHMHSAQYNIGCRIVLKGDLDIVKFHEAVSTLPLVFDAYKMRFDFKAADFTYWHHLDFNDAELIEIDFSSQRDGEKEAKAWMRKNFNIAFELNESIVPFEHYLIKIADNEHWLYLKYHHLIADGYGCVISINYLAKKYCSLLTGASLIVNYPSYQEESIRANNYYDSDSYKQNENYWKTKITAKPEKLLLKRYPANNFGNGIATCYNINITDRQLQVFKQMQLVSNASLQQLTIAALIIYFGNTSSTTDFVFGIPVHKRGSKQLRNTVGMFSGFLPFKGEFNDSQTLIELITTIISAQKQDYRYYNYQIGDLSRALNINAASDQVFDVIVNYEPLNFDLDFGPDIDAELWRLTNESERNPLQFCWRDYNGHQLRLEIQFCYEYFSLEEIEFLGERILNIMLQFPKALNKIINKIEVLPLYEHALISAFSFSTYADNLSKSRNESVISLFEAQVSDTPDAIAVTFEGTQLSYKTLNERSNQLARYLQKRGVSSETLVTICIERGIEMLIGIFGILKAGGAYVPIDPDYPEERICFILEDTGSAIIISSSSTVRANVNQGTIIVELDTELQNITKENAENLKTVIEPNQLAYIIYTSGSTGKPKGVMIEHKGVVNLALGQEDALQLKPGMRTLQFSSIGFDASCYEIFNTLLSGGCLVMCSKHSLLTIDGFKELIDTENIELAVIPPSFQQVIEHSPGNLKTIVSAGEPMNERVGIHIQSLGIRLINAYGPTESTVCATLSDNPIRKDNVIAIGRPVSNTRIHILGGGGNEAPIGVPGEICIGGVQVARGYLNRAELTAEKFVRDPYSEEAGARLYRTGDVGRWLADGNVEYLGRIDDQVKIRGYRIELGEIESVLLQHSGIRQAVVLARADAAGNKRLTGYIVAEAGTYDKDELESYLGERLPEYMVPRLWVELESLPLTANGKTDKKALPEADVSEQLKAGYAAAETELEIELVKIWEELLGVEGIGTKDNFFELGGHSLLAMRVISRLRQSMGVELQIRDLFRYPRIGDLAARVPGLKRTEDREIGVQVRPAYIPLSYSQERLWFIDRLEGSVQYHVPGVLKLSGKPDVQALEASLRTIVNRHEVLRTVIREHEGQGYQEVKEKDGWQLKQTDLSTITTTTNSVSTLDDYIAAAVQVPFDLSSDDMLRAELIKGIDGDYALLVVMHHIASDGWSMPVLVGEFRHLYGGYTSGREVKLSPLEIQYADYSIWQRATLSGALLEQKLDYWKTRLSGVATLQLPGDHTRPAVQGTAGSHYDFMISKAVSKGIQGLSLEHGVTPYMTLLSVFKVLLYRYSGQEDICVGSPVANRDREELSGLIGFFVNTLALRSSVKGETPFRELLAEVRETTLAAYEHQDVPFEKVVEAVVKERDLGRSPLFQVMFVLQNMAAMPELTLGDDIRISAEAVMNATSKYDLGMNLEETPEGIRVSVEYNTELYEKATIVRLSGHYLNLLDSVLKDPDKSVGELEMLGESELEELRSFNDTGVSYPQDATVISLFEAQAASTPGATALVFEGREMSYGELNSRSNQLARYLVKAGVQKETLVVICLERGFEMLISILGIMKAGGAYVPVDPEYPAERIGFMLSDTGAPVVLCSSNTNQQLQDQATTTTTTTILIDGDWTAISKEDTNLGLVIDPGQLAYVIYTSGSTGKPKGVMVEHGNVVSLIKNAGYITNSAIDTLLVTGSPSFDATTFEYWSMLLNGGKLILCDNNQLYNSTSLKKLITTYKVTVMWFTSSWFNQLADDNPSVFNGLKTILVGGEKLSAGHIKKIGLMYPGLALINGYGPTENTTFSLTYLLTNFDDLNNIPIGRPLNNRYAYVLSPEHKLSPVGVPGEIWLGGAGVARGYLNQPELTHNKFVNDTYSKINDARLYKTGDMGRWLANGNIEYLGRLDNQVKIRGYRIELGEIESVLLQHNTVSQAAVLATPDVNGINRLTGYIVANTTFDRHQLEQYLKEKLPEYMVPRLWVNLESFPLTSNGKINKKALPAANLSEEILTGYIAPRNELEIQLTMIWQDLLGLEKIGVHDNFFELGGHSVLAMRIIHHVERKLSISIPVNILFQFASIDGLSKYVAIRQANNTSNQTTSFKTVDI